jgi:mono/diheme cytochrome c family protein
VRAIGALVLLAGACASAPPPQEKTIEPPPSGEDDTFVLSRTPARARVQEVVPVHIADAWWGFRSAFLKMSEGKARERDSEIGERQAPEGFWDEQTASETYGLWATFCNECHGGRRKLEDVVRMPAPAAGWGRGDGLFFGARRPYAEIFRTITLGKIEKDGNRYRMPAWKGKLAREQIWALMYFIEYQSGGVEGRFPPSLFPRGEAADR